MINFPSDNKSGSKSSDTSIEGQEEDLDQLLTPVQFPLSSKQAQIGSNGGKKVYSSSMMVTGSQGPYSPNKQSLKSDALFEDTWSIIFDFSFDQKQKKYLIEENELERLCDLLNQNTPYCEDDDEETHNLETESIANPYSVAEFDDKAKKTGIEDQYTRVGTQNEKTTDQSVPRRSTVGLRTSFMSHRNSTIQLIFSPITKEVFRNFLQDLAQTRENLIEKKSTKNSQQSDVRVSDTEDDSYSR